METGNKPTVLHHESNLSQAAYLLALAIPLIEIKSEPGSRRVTWAFDNTDDRCGRALIQFSNRAQIAALDYAAALLQLKRTLPSGGAR